MKKPNSKLPLASPFLLQVTDLNKNIIIKNVIEAENKKDPKYKTELCKKFQATGRCPYGFKCQFAHGKEELIVKHQGKNYKKRLCKTFYEKGYCPYGSRCNFKHCDKKFFETNLSYFYFQLFLLKKYNNYLSGNYLLSFGSNLINDRLPIFKSITKNLSEVKKDSSDILFEPNKDDSIKIYHDRKYSQSTVSNTSYEEDKKYSNN